VELWNRECAPSQTHPGSVRFKKAPLDAFFEQRTSHYTFDDKPVSERALHSLLWSAAGEVNATHPRSGPLIAQRTLASAGAMHLLKVFVAPRRQVGRYAPGVYRGARQVALTRPFRSRRFIAADPVVGAMRYRDRSLQYLFMEAGADAQRGVERPCARHRTGHPGRLLRTRVRGTLRPGRAARGARSDSPNLRRNMNIGPPESLTRPAGFKPPHTQKS